MKRPRYLDFTCPACGHTEERFVETNDDGTPCEEQVCSLTINCMKTMVPQELAAPLLKTIVKGNHDYNERERERLEKRGDDHWRREGRHEAIERERTMLKKNGMEGAGGVK